MGRPLAVLEVPEADRVVLERWTRRPKSANALAMRARIVLASARGESNTEIATQLRLSKPTVGKWRARYLARGVDGLLDEPRPGAPRTIRDEDVDRVVTLTLETTPEDATHWSTRDMARRTGMSQSTVSRIWRAFMLKPHRSETFKISKDPLFIEKVRDIVGLSQPPPTGRWCWPLTKSPRSRRWIAASRCCRCGRARSNGGPMTTSATAPRLCLPRSTSRVAP